MKRYVFPLAFSALFTQSCGGGGASGTAPAAGPSAKATPLRAQGSVAFSISIPKGSTGSSQRRSDFVSPNTQSIVIDQLAANPPYSPIGNPVVVNVTPTSPGCSSTSSETTCTLTFPAAAGTFDFSVASFAGLNGGGALLANNALTTATIVAGVANTLSVTLNGSIGSVTLPNSVSGTSGAPQIVNFSVQDASGATIVGAGTYGNGPLTITDSAGFVTLSPASFSGPSSTSSFSAQCTAAGAGTIQFADPAGSLGSLSYACSGPATIYLTPGSLDFSTLANGSSDPTYDQIVTVTDGNVNVVSQSPELVCTPGPGNAGGATALAETDGTDLWAIRPLDVGTCTFSVSDLLPGGVTASSQSITIEIHATNYTIMSHARKQS